MADPCGQGLEAALAHGGWELFAMGALLVMLSLLVGLLIGAHADGELR